MSVATKPLILVEYCNNFSLLKVLGLSQLKIEKKVDNWLVKT